MIQATLWQQYIEVEYGSGRRIMLKAYQTPSTEGS